MEKKYSSGPMFNKPIRENLKEFSRDLTNYISALYENSPIQTDVSGQVEYARVNGQIWGLLYAKNHIDLLLKSEEMKKIWELEKQSGMFE